MSRIASVHQLGDYDRSEDVRLASAVSHEELWARTAFERMT